MSKLMPCIHLLSKVLTLAFNLNWGKGDVSMSANFNLIVCVLYVHGRDIDSVPEYQLTVKSQN